MHSKNTEPKKVIAELRKFREKHALEGLSIRDMIEEGRASTTPRLKTEGLVGKPASPVD
jgi:hypothetical protein